MIDTKIIWFHSKSENEILVRWLLDEVTLFLRHESINLDLGTC